MITQNDHAKRSRGLLTNGGHGSQWIQPHKKWPYRVAVKEIMMFKFDTVSLSDKLPVLLLILTS